jgi:hypothetical protein
MNSSEQKKTDLKKKLLHEMRVYWGNVVYLTFVFAAFTQYRRLLLAIYDISYTNYGVAFVKALILAKVIMIGEAIRLGRGLESKPLIYPTLYKTFVFTLFVIIFSIIEHLIKGVWHGEEIKQALMSFLAKGAAELIANSVVVFVAFIPFFAIKELERVFGADNIRSLFFKNRNDNDKL